MTLLINSGLWNQMKCRSDLLMICVIERVDRIILPDAQYIVRILSDVYAGWAMLNLLHPDCRTACNINLLLAWKLCM